MSARLDRTLLAAMSNKESLDRDREVSVVVEPTATSSLEELEAFLSGFGGLSKQQARNTVRMRVRVGDLSKIANGPVVGSIRAARLHSVQTA